MSARRPVTRSIRHAHGMPHAGVALHRASPVLSRSCARGPARPRAAPPLRPAPGRARRAPSLAARAPSRRPLSPRDPQRLPKSFRRNRPMFQKIVQNNRLNFQHLPFRKILKRPRSPFFPDPQDTHLSDRIRSANSVHPTDADLAPALPAGGGSRPALPRAPGAAHPAGSACNC